MLLRMVSWGPLEFFCHSNIIMLSIFSGFSIGFCFWQEFRNFVSEDFGQVVEDVFLGMGALAGRIWKYLLQLISGDLW